MSKYYLNSDDQLDDLMITEDSYLNLNLSNEVLLNITVMTGCGLELVINGKDYIKNMNIILFESAKLKLYELSLNGEGKTKISLAKDSELDYYSSTIVNKDIVIDLDVDHLESDNKAQITNHAVNLNGSKVSLNINDRIMPRASGVVSTQDSKIIDMANGENKIRPNLIVENDEVVANHSSYVGRFKEEELFYLSSRGIKEAEAKNLLVSGFLINNMKLNNKDMSNFKLFIIENMEGNYE